MSKYIIIHNSNSTNQHIAGSEEELACEIASRILLDDSDASDYYAINGNNAQASAVILKNQALCSLEINDENIKIWNTEIAKIFQKEKELQKCIEKAWFSSNDIWQDLMNLGDSTCCSEIQMHEDFSLEYHFSCLDENAHVDLSEDLMRIFEYKLISD